MCICAPHVYLWDAKRSELYLRPLIEELRDNPRMVGLAVIRS